jgi:hypothetical protein
MFVYCVQLIDAVMVVDLLLTLEAAGIVFGPALIVFAVLHWFEKPLPHEQQRDDWLGQ